jgi:WD40 repeat protein
MSVTLLPKHELSGISISMRTCFDKAGDTYAVNFPGSVYVYNRKQQKKKNFLSPSTTAVGLTAIALSPKNNYLVYGDNSGRLAIVNLLEKSKTVTLLHNTEICDIRFSDNGRMFVSVSRDGNIVLWDFAILKPILRINLGEPTFIVRFDRENKHLIVVSRAGKKICTRKWAIEVNHHRSLYLRPMYQEIFEKVRQPTRFDLNTIYKTPITISKNNTLVNLVFRTFVHQWNTKNLDTVSTRGIYEIKSIHYSPNEKYLAIARTNKSISIRDAQNGDLLHKTNISGHYSHMILSWGIDSRHIFYTSNDHTLQYYDWQNKRTVGTKRAEQGIQSIRVSKDGKWIALGEWQGNQQWTLNKKNPDGNGLGGTVNRTRN